MERCFSMEAKCFSFSAKAEAFELRGGEEEGGFVFLGLQGSAWLMATIEEALKAPVKDFVKYFREDVKALMVRGGGNKTGSYQEVVAYVEGDRKGVIWLAEGREGWGWSRVVGELQKMLTFLGSKARSLVSEASTSEGIQKGGVSSSHLGGASPSFAEVVRGEVVSHVKLTGLLGFGVRATWVGSASRGVV